MKYKGYQNKSNLQYQWEDTTTSNIISHMVKCHGLTRTGETFMKPEPLDMLELQKKGAFSATHWSIASPFPIDEFKRLYLEFVICDNLTLRQSVSI